MRIRNNIRRRIKPKARRTCRQEAWEICHRRADVRYKCAQRSREASKNLLRLYAESELALASWAIMSTMRSSSPPGLILPTALDAAARDMCRARRGERAENSSHGVDLRAAAWKLGWLAAMAMAFSRGGRPCMASMPIGQ